jgi:hypothetical protein
MKSEVQFGEIEMQDSGRRCGSESFFWIGLKQM